MMFSDIFWLRVCAIQMVSTFSKFWGYRSRKAAYRKLLRVHFLQNTKKECGSTPANRDGEVGTGYRGLLKLAVKHILIEIDVGQLYSTKG